MDFCPQKRQAVLLLFAFFTVRLLAPIQVTSSGTKTTCLRYRIPITNIGPQKSHSCAVIPELFIKDRHDLKTEKLIMFEK